jgi:arylsulfatase A-like enzyme
MKVDMAGSALTRRSFLKLLSLLSLTPLLHEPVYSPGSRNGSPESQQMPNVLILLFDALSAKHLSVHGYERETTPNLARLAEKATVYHAHYAAGNFTSSGTASLLTGSYPWTHRALHHGGEVIKEHQDRNLFHVLSGNGYSTMAYTHNLWVTLLLNQFRQDLDNYLDPREFCLVDDRLYARVFAHDASIAYYSFEDFLLPRRREQTSGSLFMGLADKVRWSLQKEALRQEYASLFPREVPQLWHLFFILEQAIDGIKALIDSSRQPFLAYFHLLPPHDPYSPRREFVGMFEDSWEPVAKPPHVFSQGYSDPVLNRKRRRYDEYVAYADAEFGRLYDFMEQKGILDRTYLVLTSDHGEMFERGIWRHNTPTLYEPIIRVPLLISKPGRPQRTDVHTPTSCVDLLPTLSHITDRAIPEWCEGELLPTFGDQEPNDERSIYAVQAVSNAKRAPLTKATVALIKGHYKLIQYLGYDGYEDRSELYNLEHDPEEMDDRFEVEKSVAQDLKNELKAKLAEANEAF